MSHKATICVSKICVLRAPNLQMGLGRFFHIFCVFYSISVMVSGDGITQDQTTLLTLMSEIVPSKSIGWNLSGIHACDWDGIKCDKSRTRVIELDLSGKSLHGRISPGIENLSSLMVLDLSRNFLHGEIPKELGRLIHLTQVSLSWNYFQGKIPQEFGMLQNLEYLDLGSNNLVGNIPSTLFCNASSSSLLYVDLSNNSLSGEIPLRDECELRELRFLLLWSNSLSGEIPAGLRNSSKLKWLDLESNSLRGELPSEIIRTMPELQFLYLSYNSLSSHDQNTNLEPFFESLVNLSNFQELELAGNNLGGKIPGIIGNLSRKLVQIHLDQNRIHGSIPPQISSLVNLTLLNLSNNFLNGTIPPEFCQMRRLERVFLSNNSLSGSIPAAFGDIPHLGLLDLSINNLSGSIPDSFSNLSQLRRLLLHTNHLSGTIPPSLGKCVNLEILDLSHNRISGRIPPEVAGLNSLKLYLNLSHNQLNGHLPLEISKMDMVLSIDLSYNNLSGSIPPQIESCIALESLNLSHNNLQGHLPSSIGQLPYLKLIDISSNKLYGEIPSTFQDSTTLKKLNFSFNSFTGEITNKGSFSFLTMESFQGNIGLCGSIKGMSSCKNKHGHFDVLLIPILLSVFIISPLLCIFGLKAKFRTKLSSEEEKEEKKYTRVTYAELIQATNGFNPSNLIGTGQFGQVYKGVLPDNTRIAVKVLESNQNGKLTKSFKRECQVLKRTKHRNLIRIITACSRQNFKAIVLPLMVNGSLERYLYESQKLDLIQMVKICSDVAEGLVYLHHYCPVKVVHCDLKPSNVLLDEDFTALVTDFGIARLVKGGEEDGYGYGYGYGDGDGDGSFGSTDGLLCGSVGYIAPGMFIIFHYSTIFFPKSSYKIYYYLLV